MNDRVRPSDRDSSDLGSADGAAAPGRRTLTQRLGARRSGAVEPEVGLDPGPQPAASPRPPADDPFGLHLLDDSVPDDAGERDEDAAPGETPVGAEVGAPVEATPSHGDVGATVEGPGGAASQGGPANDGHNLRSPRFRGEPRLEACYDDKDRLKIGEGGEPVKKVKDALIALGYGKDLGPRANLPTYDFATWTTVQKFKRTEQLGFEQFGDVGPGTMKRLDEKFSSIHPIDPPVFPKDLPVPPGPKVAPTSTTFRIKFLGGLGAGTSIIAGDVLFFQIADDTNKLTGFYTYTAFGTGKGALPLSVTKDGAWSSFVTAKPVTLSNFSALASWKSMGGGPFTVNHLDLFGLPCGDVHLEIQTGMTFGLGASATVGLMTMKPDKPMPL